jgi:hypothetical protein
MAALQGPLARGLIIALLAGLFMAWAGAFGSGSAPLAVRLVYWMIAMTGGTVFGVATNEFVERRGILAQRPWLQGALTAVLMAVPYTFVIWGLTRLVFSQSTGGSVFTAFADVLVISGVMVAINRLATKQPLETHASSPGAPPPRFLERLPAKLRGGDLYAVEAEDHYLRLHTSKGTDLILMRLADAIAELEGLEGAQTHRSWWVARDAVVSARRADGRAVLALPSGVEAPVSRSYAKALRDEGWF